MPKSAATLARLGAAAVGVTLLLGVTRVTAVQQTVTIGPGETAIVDSITVFNGTGQPANVALSDDTLDVAVPVQFGVVVAGADCAAVVPASNFARCKVAPGARLVLTLGGMMPTPEQPPAPAEQPFPQPPAALARAGAGAQWDRPPRPTILLAECAALLVLLAAASAAVYRCRLRRDDDGGARAVVGETGRGRSPGRRQRRWDRH